jgi:predicted O-methyltransferase YrrM
MTKFMVKNYQNKKLIGAEIGVEYGLNAKTMLKLLSIEKLYLIDPYVDQDDASGDRRYEDAKRYLAKYGSKIKFIRLTSEKAANEIPDNLDFVYIDGSHKYKIVKRDIELFYKKVKKGGIIGGHDFWASEVGVCKAVLEFAKNNNLKLNGKLTDWWIIKK